MREAALDPYLAFIVSNQDVRRPKPDPEMYAAAIARFGVSAHEVLIVEDNEHGLRAARASGAHVMAVDGADDVTYAAIATCIVDVQNRQAA